MIRVYTGSNSYAIRLSLQQRQRSFEGAVERVDGVDIDLNKLADLFAGGGLFAERKLVIISELSGNKIIWPQLADWLDRVDSDTELILIEPKPDKRTSAYKALKAVAEFEDFPNWTDREQVAATKWVIAEAGRRGLEMDRASAAELVRRSLVETAKVGWLEVDQWRLHFGLEKLRAVGTVTVDVVRDLIDAESFESSFGLLEATLTGDVNKLQRQLESLRQTEEPHQLFGLLSGQLYQLAALVHADKPAAVVASDIGAHPYAITKLQGLARQTGADAIRRLASDFASTDRQIKTSGHNPWLLIESLLLGIASRS